MAISFWILLIPYAVIVLIFFIISGFGIYHSLRFGFRSSMVRTVTAVYVTGTVIILILSIIGILTLDWSQSFDFLQ